MARTQELQNCDNGVTPLTVGSTEDAGALGTLMLECPGKDFTVQWVGEVFLQGTIRLAGGTSLNITGAGPGAVADGGSNTQLFHVDEDSTLHLLDMTLANGNASTGDGGAIFVNGSTVSFGGSTSFVSNSAGNNGGAIYAYDSTVSWDADGTQFSNNSAGEDGGAIYATYNSTVFWNGDSAQFSDNAAGDNGGAIYAYLSNVSWVGDDTQFRNNTAGYSAGAIWTYISSVSWGGDGTQFRNNHAYQSGTIRVSSSTLFWSGDSTQFISNSADRDGSAIDAYLSTVSWDGDSTQFSHNSAENEKSPSRGTIAAESSTVSWNGDSTKFSNNSANSGGAIYASESTVFWDGDRTQFSDNSADTGGAIYALRSIVSWNGDRTQFSNNSADNGGAIYAAGGLTVSTVSWNGDSTQLSHNSAVSGGAIAADRASVSWHGASTQFRNNYAVNGGAIIGEANSTISWDCDGTLFSNNSAENGGAIYVYDVSTVSWNGADTLFSNNFARRNGGVIYTLGGSAVSWDGRGTQFGYNSADLNGGTLYTDGSSLSWGGNGTMFGNNYANSGGVVCATGSNVSWGGNGTLFSNNYAGADGGAIAATDSNVSWHGDGTLFSNNAADEKGGAIAVFEHSTVSWECNGTLFSNNVAGEDGGAICASLSAVSWAGDSTLFTSNNAAKDGGAIFAVDFERLSWNGNPIFSSNIAGANGGALAFVDIRYEHDPEPFTAATLVDNRAGYGGGALYMMDCELPLNFTDVMFKSNVASGAGGAVTAQFAGDESSPVAFTRCTFSRNKAANSGGAVEILSGHQQFESCRFEGNSADIGGAMVLGGIRTVIRECSFLSNSVSSRGLAVAVAGSAEITSSTFDRNELDCASGFLYREDAEEGGPNKRYEAVCFDCPDWDECSGCTMTRGDVKPVCEMPLEHTTAEGPGVTVETLTIARGYWRATNQSESILACYNADACIGGATGADGYCAPGYMGPYCAVCGTGYSSSLAHTCTRCSSSRRQGLMAATAIGAAIAVLVVVSVCRYVLSAELAEEERGCFRRRVLRAVPLQALKIVVVVWQILTQFAEAASLSYPGDYREFLNAVSIINFDLGSVLSAGCLWSEIDFHGRLLVSTVWPLVAVGFLSITYWIAMGRIGNTADDAGAIETIRRKHQTVLLLLTFLVYSSVSSLVFQTFACDTLDDGVEYLRADYSIQCTDPKHKAFEVYAGIMVMVYPVGIPLLYAVQLFQHRGVLADDDADKAAAQPIVGLWEPYRAERFYYEVVECGRRIMLTGVVVFIFPNDAAQVAITLLIAVFFFGVLEVLSPYKSESDMWLSRGGHVLVFLSMFYMLLLKVDVSSERDESQAVFAGVFVAGHVLMVFAIVVEVVGVCYASRKKEVGEKGMSSEVFPLRARAGSDDVPVFETVPSKSWKFFLSRSVSDEPGPTRRVAATETGVLNTLFAR